MRLAAIGIDRRAGVAEGLDQLDEFRALPLEGIVVVVDQDGIRPALMCHFKSFDDPVITCLTVTAQGSLVGSRLVPGDRLIDDIDERQVGVMRLDGIHPFLDGLVLLLGGKVVEP